jgi:hypothetical protein
VTLHYHGGPFTPLDALYEMRGRSLCVSFGRPEQIDRMKEMAQVVMKDNGAFKAHNDDKKAGREPTDRDWTPYYAWVEKHHRPGDWAVIPDVIDGGSQLQDALLREWPFGHIGAPVWHMDEPIRRLLRLCDEWPRVCIGSTAEFWQIGTDAWHHRMTDTWNQLMQGRRFVPNIHMLRGMALSNSIYPFASVDSTDIAQNHNRPQNTPRGMADRWDALQCPATWTPRALQQELVA